MANAMEPNAEVFNEALALASVGGDREFLTELVGLFQAAWPTLLVDIRKGIAEGDLRGVERAARITKAAVRNVLARRSYESARHLEAVASMGDWPSAHRARASLEQEVERLQAVLPTLGNSDCSA